MYSIQDRLCAWDKQLEALFNQKLNPYLPYKEQEITHFFRNSNDVQHDLKVTTLFPDTTSFCFVYESSRITDEFLKRNPIYFSTTSSFHSTTGLSHTQKWLAKLLIRDLNDTLSFIEDENPNEADINQICKTAHSITQWILVSPFCTVEQEQVYFCKSQEPLNKLSMIQQYSDPSYNLEIPEFDPSLANELNILNDLVNTFVNQWDHQPTSFLKGALEIAENLAFCTQSIYGTNQDRYMIKAPLIALYKHLLNFYLFSFEKHDAVPITNAFGCISLLLERYQPEHSFSHEGIPLGMRYPNQTINPPPEKPQASELLNQFDRSIKILDLQETTVSSTDLIDLIQHYPMIQILLLPPEAKLFDLLHIICSKMPQLKVLDISGTLFSYEMGSYLSHMLSNIEHLNLSYCQGVTDEALKLLIENFKSSLIYLDIMGVDTQIKSFKSPCLISKKENERIELNLHEKHVRDILSCRFSYTREIEIPPLKEALQILHQYILTQENMSDHLSEMTQIFLSFEQLTRLLIRSPFKELRTHYLHLRTNAKTLHQITQEGSNCSDKAYAYLTNTANYLASDNWCSSITPSIVHEMINSLLSSHIQIDHAMKLRYVSTLTAENDLLSEVLQANQDAFALWSHMTAQTLADHFSQQKYPAFMDAILFLGHSRYCYAGLQPHSDNANIFGAIRDIYHVPLHIAHTSPETQVLFTPTAGETYGKWHTYLRSEFAKVCLSWDNLPIHSEDGEGRLYKGMLWFRHDTDLGERFETHILSEYDGEIMLGTKILDEGVPSNFNDPGWHHSMNRDIYYLVREVFHDILDMDRDDDELITQLGLLYHMMTQASFCVRGSATLTHWLFNALCLHKQIEPPPFITLLDCWALSMGQQTFLNTVFLPWMRGDDVIVNHKVIHPNTNSRK